MWTARKHCKGTWECFRRGLPCPDTGFHLMAFGAGRQNLAGPSQLSRRSLEEAKLCAVFAHPDRLSAKKVTLAPTEGCAQSLLNSLSKNTSPSLRNSLALSMLRLARRPLAFF